MIRLERRTEIIELNFTQACQILAAGLPGAVLRSHRLLPGGRANTNYLLETDDGACVLRMYVRDATTREKETALANMLAELPVPRVLGVGDVDAFPPFALFEFRRGRPLAEWLTESALPESAARNIGRLLAQTSKYSFERFGDLRVVDDGLCAVAWEVGENALLGFMRWCLFESPAGERLGPRARDRLWEITQREAEHDDGLPPTLSHGDFNPTNILLDETGTVTALLDWEFAHAGGPLSDIGNLLRVRDEYELPATFADELHAGISEGGLALPQDWRARAAFTDLTSACEFLSSVEEKPQTHAAAKRQVHAYLDKHAGE